MFYYTSCDDEQLKIEVIDDPDGHTRVILPDGREMRVDLQAALGENFFSLLVDKESHEVYREKGEEAGDYNLTLDGQTYQVRVATERQHRFATLAPNAHAQSGEVTVKAPMPGLVSIVSVEIGQEVAQGQRLIVLEAMKMENELRAPKAGKIKAINVSAGQTVEQNRALVVLE